MIARRRHRGPAAAGLVVAAWAAAARLALALPAAEPPGGDSKGKELSDLPHAIDARRERLESFERREHGLLETLEGIDRAASDLSQEVSGAQERAHEARQALDLAERVAREAAERQAITRRAMTARVVALYKAGSVGPVRAIFTASGPRELLARMYALQNLLERDAALVSRYRREGERLTRAREAALAAAAERDRAAVRLARGSRELGLELASKQDLLKQVRTDRAREQAAIQELEAASQALESTLEGLRAGGTGTLPSRAPSVPFASLRGQLPPPVAAPLVQRFGRVVDSEFRTETFRKGVDFAAQLGQPVHAVADGEVRYAGWFRGYGKLVIVDHGEQYFTVAGHLDEIRVQVGDALRAGDVIGTAGETGSLGGALLYFEIRRGSEALDPSEWLAP
ncbi:MAG TPA: peptidoglycan DD-metalloendopeptidase family protein [Myxococcota bacterium]|nr:peptidoglycan DD-metalloendopeptidase family protein [Myxococcota bacterium]